MAVSMSDLRSTFGGGVGASGTVSLSQFYRGGSLVPDVSTNNSIATGSAGTTIRLGSFSNRTNLVNVSYQLIGGGGGGGWANQELNSQQNGIPSTAGSTTSISGAFSASAAGGAGGAGGTGGQTAGTAGANSVWGTGGAGGAIQGGGNQKGGDATGYGAGGGGGGGDTGATSGNPLFSDTGGWRGDGGSAGTYVTGSTNVAYKSSISITIGTAGSGGYAQGYADTSSGGGWSVWSSHGGNGSPGRVYITRNYNTPINNDITSSGSLTI